MADRIPLKLTNLGSGAGQIEEFGTGDTVPISQGGTGADSAAGALKSLGAVSSLLPSLRNLLINGDMLINQRAFAGGSLSAGVYGYDRWKAGTGGCSVTVNTSTKVITHASGSLVQVIEAPGLAGQVITVSIGDPSGSVTIDVDGVSDTITAGSGRRGVTLAVPGGSAGNVTLTLTATGVTYSQVQLERGSRATGWDARPPGLEEMLCWRYCWRPIAKTYMAVGMGNNGFVQFPFRPPVKMRAAPSITVNTAGSVFNGTTQTTLGTGTAQVMTFIQADSFAYQAAFASGITNGGMHSLDNATFTATAEL